MALRDPLAARPEIRNGRIAPMSNPEKMSGSLSEMAVSEAGVSNLAFLRNPPKRDIPTNAEQIMLMFLLIEEVERLAYSSWASDYFSS